MNETTPPLDQVDEQRFESCDEAPATATLRLSDGCPTKFLQLILHCAGLLTETPEDFHSRNTPINVLGHASTATLYPSSHHREIKTQRTTLKSKVCLLVHPQEIPKAGGRRDPANTRPPLEKAKLSRAATSVRLHLSTHENARDKMTTRTTRHLTKTTQNGCMRSSKATRMRRHARLAVQHRYDGALANCGNITH